MGCCNSLYEKTGEFQLSDPSLLSQLGSGLKTVSVKNVDVKKISKDLASKIDPEALNIQAGKRLKELKDQASELNKITTDFVADMDGKLEDFVVENVKDQAVALGNRAETFVVENVKDPAIALGNRAETFVVENVKDPAIALGNRAGTFVRENVQATLDAIKDLKLKQRVSDIIYPIFRRFFVHSVHGCIEDMYEIHEIVGQGSFSTVRKVVSIATGQVRAIKIMAKNSLTDTQRVRISEETEILRSLDHPNIIKIIEVIEDTTKINIVTEICSGGELFDRIIKNRSFTESDASSIMCQILSGLIHIHSAGYVHRDIKPENILFVEPDQMHLKIIDFGISQKVKDKSDNRKFCAGSAYYIAPEVIAGQYDQKCDVWSAGVLMYILLCGYPPFNGKTEADIFAKISRGVFGYSGKEWGGVSKEAKDLIKKMLTKDVTKRPTAEEVWNDTWIQSQLNNMREDNPLSLKVLNNLKDFRINFKLQQVALSYIAYHLTTSQEINELRNAFVILDANGDGHLSIEELKIGFENTFLSASVDIDNIIKKCDTDLNGFIDYNEFITASIDWSKHLTYDLLETAFKSFDTDKSGTISISEIKDLLGGEARDSFCEKIINDVDSDENGEIDLEEFKKIMLSVFIQ